MKNRMKIDADTKAKAEKYLESPRLFLEPLTVDHAEKVFDQMQDKKSYLFIPQNPPTSLNDLQMRYQKLQTRQSVDDMVKGNSICRKR